MGYIQRVQLLAALQKITSAKHVLYRGVQDVMPSQMQKMYTGQGIFGSGMYFAFDYDDAENYRDGTGYDEDHYRRWGIVAEYTLNLGNSIVLSPSSFIFIAIIFDIFFSSRAIN